MRILLAVIDDLFQFASSALFGVLTTKLDGGYFASHSLPEEKTQSLFPDISEDQVEMPTFATDMGIASFTAGSQYFIGVPGTFLYVDPVVSFDTASLQLPYATLVEVIKLGGRWAHIKTKDSTGWIFKDSLREQAKDVFPFFTQDAVYDADNEETKKLRLCISDMFGGAVGALPLTDAEYVTYKLGKKGRAFPWTLERPRVAGTWQKKLRGRPLVHIGIVPKTDSVMEYIIEDEGHLCYVEAVFPDESMKISAIGMYAEGTYVEIMIQKDEWKELRPVFIEIT